MAIPTTTKANGGAGYDIFDWYRHANLTPAGDAYPNDPTIPTYSIPANFGNPIYHTGSAIPYPADTNYLQLTSSGAADVAQIAMSSAVPAKYTYQVEMYFHQQDWLPATFEDGRVGIGVFDSGSTGLRVCVAQEGIGFLPQNDPTASLQLLSGSADILQYPCHLKLHFVSDGESGNVTLYGTTEDAAGAQIGSNSWTIAAPESTAGITDVADFYCSGATAVLESFRLSSLELSSNVKPTAVVAAPDTGVVGRAMKLNGTGSYDPEGLPITYAWEIVTAPEGATPVLGGLVPAEITVTGGMGSVITLATSYQGTSGNLYTLEIQHGTLDLDLTGYALTATVPATTTLIELVYMINESTKYGQPAIISQTFEAELTTGNGLDATPLFALSSFSGGVDSTKPDPVFVPMAEGNYTLGLTVNDGVFSGAQVLHTISVSPLDSLLETLPEADFIWDTLPDFWGKLSQTDRSVFTTIWSSFMQLMTGQLLRAWQDDYAKSLADIPLKYQRKWVGFPSEQEVTGDISGFDGYVKVSLTLQDDEDTDVNTQLFLLAGGSEYYDLLSSGYYGVFSSNETVFSDLVAQVVVTGDTPVYLTTDAEHAAYTETASGDSGKMLTESVFHTAYGVFPATCAGDILYTNSNYYHIDSVDPTDSTRVNVMVGGTNLPGFPTLFEVSTAPFTGVVPGQMLHLRGTLAANVGTFAITAVDPAGVWVICGAAAFQPEVAIPWGIDADPIRHPYYNPPYCTKDYSWAGFSSTGLHYSWSILSPVNTSYELVLYPKFDITETPPMHALAKISYEVNGTTYYSYPPIRHYTDDMVFVDWFAFARDLAALDTADLFATSFSAGLKEAIQNIIDDKETYSALFAYLSELEAALVGYVAHTYLPADDSILEVPVLKDTITGDTTYYYPANYDLATESDGNQYISWEATTLSFTWIEGTISGLTADPGLIYLPSGDVLKTYDYDSTAGTATVDAHPISAGAHTGWAPKFGVLTDIPEIAWAEVVYFSNDETISDNFGAVVGLPKVAQEHYKSDVTALWFCLWNGPTLANLEIAANAIVDRQLFLIDGTIMSIDPVYNATEGRVFVLDDVTGLVFVYPYNKVLGLAINPTTDAAYAVGDTVEQYWPINGGLTVEDYKSDADWFARYLTGENIVKRYFYFTVKIAAGAALTEDDIELLVQQFHMLKPQYTDIIFVIVLNQEDAVDVVAEHSFSVSVHVADNPAQAIYTTATPTVAPTVASIPANAVAFPPRYSALPMQNHEVYESCYLAGHLDDYSGDGSWHPNAPGVTLYTSGTVTAVTPVGAQVDIADGTASFGNMDGYYVHFPTLGPYGLWATIDPGNTAISFRYTPDSTWFYPNPIITDAYEIYSPENAVVSVNQLDSDEDHSKSITWLRVTLGGTTGFQPNEWVTGALQGRARVLYVQNLLHPENHPESFVLVQRRPEDSTVPVEMGKLEELDFVVADTITGGTSGETGVIQTIRTYPSYIFEVDGGLMRPDSHPGPTTSFYSPAASMLPALDHGLVIDDVEPYVTPTGSPTVPTSNLVPSFDYGQFWWVDVPVVDDYLDVAPGAMPPAFFQPIDFWNETVPENLNDGVIAAANSFSSVSGVANSYNGAAIGDWLYVTGAANPANNGWFTITGAGATLTFAPATFTFPDANSGSLQWCCLPSWYTNTWSPVKVDYVLRNAVVYRYTLAGDRMPNVTHGHTWFRPDQWYQQPWVVAIIISPVV